MDSATANFLAPQATANFIFAFCIMLLRFAKEMSFCGIVNRIYWVLSYPCKITDIVSQARYYQTLMLITNKNEPISTEKSIVMEKLVSL